MDCGLWKETGFDFKDSFLSIIYIYIYIYRERERERERERGWDKVTCVILSNIITTNNF